MRLQLGELTLDTDTRQLLHGAAEVHLSPKAFELLRILLENRPRALSKHDLQERLWPATFVSEVNLATLIAEVRAALGDDARTPRFVRTAHRFGYAFCGTVEERAGPDASRPAALCWLIKDGRRVPLRVGENILGRETEGGLRLDSPTVSRRHARIVVAGGGATLEDLGSKNGTLLGGKPVSNAVPLNDGDVIRTGSVVLRFRMAPRRVTSTWTQLQDE
jgi:DNA-binding winged helix-turn-helix (wHTH) protein